MGLSINKFDHIKISWPLNIPEMDTFEASGKRFYKNPDGMFVPSVTTILGSRPNPAIEDWKDRVGAEEAQKILNIAGRRGTIFHSLCEHYIEGTPSFEAELNSVMPDSKESFLKVKAILDACINNIYHQETPLYSKNYRMAGRVDLIAEYGGKLSIIDFKTSLVDKKESWITNYFAQEAMYQMMFKEHTNVYIERLVTIVSPLHDNNPQIFVQEAEPHIRAAKEILKEYNSIYHSERDKFDAFYKNKA